MPKFETITLKFFQKKEFNFKKDKKYKKDFIKEIASIFKIIFIPKKNTTLL
jgi:hypothetical protein